MAKVTPPEPKAMPPDPKAAETPARPESATPRQEAKAAPAETPSAAGGPTSGARGQNPVDIRAALRPGGGGGGGGRGGGRAGIEGEPIPLDSTNPKYSDYLDRVRRMIKEKWGYPCIKRPGDCEYKTAQLSIEFGIAKDGHVPFVNVMRSSGFAVYDEYAVNAVKLASPFPPVPDSLSKTGFPINATFNYIVDSGLTNLLR